MIGACRSTLQPICAGVLSAFFLFSACNSPSGKARSIATAQLDAANGEPDARAKQGGPFIDPFREGHGRAIVFLFVSTDCPICNRYAPDINRLYAKYGSQINFWLVYPDPQTSALDIEQHRKAYRLAIPALRDPHHALVKRTGVHTTPETAVFLSDGREVYRGRIDNRYVDFGKERPAPTQRDLEDVLKTILSGGPVHEATTIAVGCYIPEAS